MAQNGKEALAHLSMTVRMVLDATVLKLLASSVGRFLAQQVPQILVVDLNERRLQLKFPASKLQALCVL